MIMDYNATKGGVDTLDLLVKNYSCKRITNRWPLVIFYWMIDGAGYKATVCFTETNSIVYSGNQKRRHFISDLAEQLCKPQILCRFRDVRANFPSQTIQCTGCITKIFTLPTAKLVIGMTKLYSTL